MSGHGFHWTPCQGTGGGGGGSGSGGGLTVVAFLVVAMLVAAAARPAVHAAAAFLTVVIEIVAVLFALGVAAGLTAAAVIARRRYLARRPQGRALPAPVRARTITPARPAAPGVTAQGRRAIGPPSPFPASELLDAERRDAARPRGRRYGPR
jgi:hypothetical protein